MPAHVGPVVVTLVPLGVTLLALFVCYASARRSGLATWSAYAAGVGTYTLVAVLLALVTGVAGADLARAFVGGATVSAARSRRRAARSPRGADVACAHRGRCGPAARRPLRTGATGGLLASAALVAVAALVTALWVLAGRATIGDVVRGLGLDAVGGVVLAVAELAYLPNLVVWALAWLTGAGFAVGAGTHFAPDDVVGGALPAVPMLGALPSADVVGPATSLVPLVLVVVGALVGLVRPPAADAAAVVGHGARVCRLRRVHRRSSSRSSSRWRAAGSARTGWPRSARRAASSGCWPAPGVLAGALLVALPGDALLRAEIARAVRAMVRRDRS